MVLNLKDQHVLHPLAVMESLLAAGISVRLCSAVEDITVRPGEALWRYYARVRANRLTLRVKRKDIEHNLSFRRQSLLSLRAVQEM